MDRISPSDAEAMAAGVAARAVGLTILDADRAIDDARRLIWLSTFGGDADDKVAGMVQPSEIATAMAADLHGLSAAVAASVLETARLLLWGTMFSKAPSSRFGRAVARDKAARAKTPRDKPLH